MNILLLQDQDDVREKLGFLLESKLGAQVEPVSTFAEAEAKLKAGNSSLYGLLIVDWKEADAVSITRLRNLSPQMPLFVAYTQSSDALSSIPSVAAFIERSTLMEDLILATERLQGGPGSDLTSDKDKVRIRTKLLLQVCPLKGDIYIRLSEKKFVKLFQVGDTFDLADMEKYTVKKGVEYLYIRKEQCLEFANKYIGELQKIMRGPLQQDDVVQLNTSVHETVQELNRQMGFNREVQEITRTQVSMTVKAMGSNPNLAQILAKMERSKDKYISAHSTVCAFISCAIAGQLKWGSETTFFKLGLASFLHDMTLENNILAEMSSIAEIEEKRDIFSEAEIQIYKNHPIDAAELAKKMSEVPPDVDTIIVQHHERPDGTGFPRKLTYSYISPLSTVFIVAHDLTHYALRNQDHFSIDLFLDTVREKYRSSQFKKVLACLETLQVLRKTDLLKSIPSKK